MDLEIKKVEVSGKEFYLRYSNRAVIMFTHRNTKNPGDYDSMVNYFYDLAKAGAKSQGIEFNYTLEEFSEVIDSDPQMIDKFNGTISQFFPKGGDEKKQKKGSR